MLMCDPQSDGLDINADDLITLASPIQSAEL
jgi:hypothetical protein